MSVDSASFDVVEADIIADAQAAARDPSIIADGTLRESVRTDEAGRRIKTYFGKPGSWMSTFGANRQVAKLRKPMQFHH